MRAPTQNAEGRQIAMAQSHAAAFCRPAIRRGSDMFIACFRRFRCYRSFTSGYCLSSYGLKIPLAYRPPNLKPVRATESSAGQASRRARATPGMVEKVNASPDAERGGPTDSHGSIPCGGLLSTRHPAGLRNVFRLLPETSLLTLLRLRLLSVVLRTQNPASGTPSELNDKARLRRLTPS